MMVMNLKLFPSCIQRPRTSSFRIETTTYNEDDVFKTIINSMCIEPEGEPIETPEPWFTSPSSESTSTTTEFDEPPTESHLELIIHWAQNSTDHHRLFFEPTSDTNSIIFNQYTSKNILNHTSSDMTDDSNVFSFTPTTRRKKQRSRHNAQPFPSPPPHLADVSVMTSFESKDPYEDFKKSMGEMIESVGMKHDMIALEEMLAWYLKANEESNHGYIVGSFVELLLAEFLGNGNNNDLEICESSFSYSSAPSILSSSTSSTSQLLLDDISDRMLC